MSEDENTLLVSRMPAHVAIHNKNAAVLESTRFPQNEHSGNNVDPDSCLIQGVPKWEVRLSENIETCQKEESSKEDSASVELNTETSSENTVVAIQKESTHDLSPKDTDQQHDNDINVEDYVHSDISIETRETNAVKELSCLDDIQ